MLWFCFDVFLNNLMNKISLLLCLFSVGATAQKMPVVHFNHLFLVFDSTDMHAINNSDFIRNNFAAFSTRTTTADSGRTWTGSYMYGTDSYFEMFGPSGVADPPGTSGLGFSVDAAGDILKLDSLLKPQYK